MDYTRACSKSSFGLLISTICRAALARACSKSFFLAVKPVTPFPIRKSFSMDEKEAEARPLMGTIFLVGRAKRAPHWGVQSRFRVIYIYIILYYMCVCRMSNHVESRESNTRMLKVSIGW